MIAYTVITRPEVEAILYRFLGPLRAWSDFLADCSRSKGSTQFHGLRLPPLLHDLDDQGRMRALYDLAAVLAFLVAAREALGPATLDRRLVRTKRTVTLDTGAMLLPPAWRRPRLAPTSSAGAIR